MTTQQLTISAATIRQPLQRTNHKAELSIAPVDSFTPSAEPESTGAYGPIASLMKTVPPQSDVAAESQQLADRVWEQFAVARDGRERAPMVAARYKVLGHPRINRPYPDKALADAGVEQDLPIEVKSPFKWLLSKPLVLGENKDIVLLHTQYEGGPTWLDDGEYECKDFFIALRRDPETGTYKEQASLMTRKPDWQDVFRSTGPVAPMSNNSKQFAVQLEEGTYSGIFGKATHLYEVSEDGIKQVGGWDSHRSPSELAGLESEKPEDGRVLHNPSVETLERMNYSRNWQTDKTL